MTFDIPRRRRADFARLVMTSCQRLRDTHRPRPPDLSHVLTHRLPSALKTKYARILQDLFKELREREVRPVHMRPLKQWDR